MRKWLMGAICATLIGGMPEGARAFNDGNHLFESATSEHPVDQLSYLMFVVGVARAFSLALTLHELDQGYCVDERTPNGDLGDAVRIWLRKNSELLDYSPATLVVVALAKHFPCETEEP